ncbi:MAG TPA: hypothetical protein VIY27_04155 [Myxococcota bacterium]
MSTILKALRRLEEEKTAPVGRRPLREEVAHVAEPPRPRRGAWALAAVALVGGVAVGVALLKFWPQPPVPQQPEPQVARAPAPALPRPAPVQREAEPQGLSDAALTSPVEVVARPKAKPLIADEPGSAPAARAPRPAARARPGTRPSPAVASPPPRAASARAPEAQRSAPQFSEIPDATAVWAESEAEAPPAVASAPSPEPGIRVEQTFWHPTRERRVAVLTLPGREQPLRVKEGDAVGGLVVSEIEPSGVVFAHEGGQVRHALGEPR